jgi:hypothetical protein
MQKSQKNNWVCPCTGCNKARKKAFTEVLEIIDGGGDAYSRIHAIRKLIQDAIIVG